MVRRVRFLGITPKGCFSLMVFTFKAEPPVHLMPTGIRPLGGVCIEVETDLW
jgi:hypothetical protein